MAMPAAAILPPSAQKTWVKPGSGIASGASSSI